MHHTKNMRAWFILNPPVSSTNKTDRHDITEILLKVALNTINPQLYGKYFLFNSMIVETAAVFMCNRFYQET